MHRLQVWFWRKREREREMHHYFCIHYLCILVYTIICVCLSTYIHDYYLCILPVFCSTENNKERKKKKEKEVNLNTHCTAGMCMRITHLRVFLKTLTSEVWNFQILYFYFFLSASIRSFPHAQPFSLLLVAQASLWFAELMVFCLGSLEFELSTLRRASYHAAIHPICFFFYFTSLYAFVLTFDDFCSARTTRDSNEEKKRTKKITKHKIRHCFFFFFLQFCSLQLLHCSLRLCGRLVVKNIFLLDTMSTWRDKWLLLIC